jgi:tetratricopeptide (TPR) repeat protein
LGDFELAGNRETFEQAMRDAYDHSWNQDWEAAIEAYKQALVESPADLAATLGLGSAFLELGQPQVALKVFERAVYLAPEDTGALTKLADVQERLGRPQDAASTQVRTGNAFARRGELEEAANAWAHALRLTPDQAEIHLQLAQVLEQLDRSQPAAAEYVNLATIAQGQGDADLAMEYCRQALRLDPDSSQAQSMFETLQTVLEPAAIDLDFWDELESEPVRSELPDEDVFSFESLTREAEETDGHSPMEQAQRRALQELADMLFEAGADGSPDLATVAIIGQAIDQQTRGIVDDAIENYRKALKAGLTRTAIFFSLGTLYYERIRYDEAVEAFRRSMRDEAYTLGSHYALGLTYRAAGNIDRSLEHFLELVKMVDVETVRPDQVESLTAIYQQLSDKHIAQGDTEKANIFTTTLLEFFAAPNWEGRTREVRRRIDTLSETGDLMTLAEYLESPETEIVVAAMALTGEYVRRNMLMTAAEECFRAIQKAPNYLPLHVRLGDIFLKQEHTQEAVTKYLVVSDVYQMRGDSEQAINIYQRVLRLAPMDVKVRAKLIDLLIVRGEVESALEHYLSLADVYYQLAQVEQALQKYDEALRLASSSADEDAWKVNILHRMGDIYNQRVDWARATMAYESIVALSSDDERARLALVELYFKQGENEKALESLDLLLGTYQRAGKSEQVLTVLQEAVQTRPEEMRLRARLAAAFARQGMASEAIAEYDALGEMQLEAGLREEAAQTIQIIIGLEPDDIEGYRSLYSQIKGGGP